MAAIAKNRYENLYGIVLVNPAIKTLEILEKLENFDYKKLNDDSTISMNSDLNKFLSKKFLDDLHDNDLFSVDYKMEVPIKLVIGNEDDFNSKTRFN